MMNPTIKLVLAFSVGAGTGALIGTLLAKKRYQSFADEEIENVKEHYKLLRKDDFPTPEDALEAYGRLPEKDTQEYKELLTDYNGGEDMVDPTPSGIDVDTDKHIVVNNIWVTKEEEEAEDEGVVTDEFVFERDPEAPYVISVEMFHQDDGDDWDKIPLVYWEKDDTLASADDDSFIEDVVATIGENALNHFGVGSQNKHTVYVRNERVNADFEITRDLRSYSEVIHGIREEKPRRVSKMRSDE